MARQKTEVELLDCFELNVNLVAGSRTNGAFDEEMAYESFSLLIERDAYRFQPAESHNTYETKILPA